MSRRILPLMFCAAGLLGLGRSAPGQPAAFSLVTRTDTYVEVDARGTRPTSRNHPTAAALAAQGNEQSHCDRVPDISAGSAQARVETEFQSSDGASFTLQADAFGKGGSFIECSGGCISIFGRNQCIFIEPQYTGGHAFARATANVDIQFADDARFLPYNLSFSVAPSTGSAPGTAPAELRLRLLAPDGSTLLSESSPGLPARIAGGGGLSYRMFVELIAQGAGEGGGREHRQGTVRFSMHLERAPIIDSADDPLIGGGETTLEYPEVGALLWDGKAHCTGTLIGRRTVLTAAHCVFGFEDVSRMSFVVGHTLKNPAPEDIAPVKALFYPQPERDGIGYEDQGLKHDIAVVALDRGFDRACQLPDVGAHQGGLPSLAELIQKEEKLTFLGFGHKVVDGVAADPGRKRKVEIPITEVEETKFYYFNPGKSTCTGDSGGPILKQLGDKFYVLGVASAGNCRDEGWQMNVEHYVDWIRTRMQEIEGDTPTVIVDDPGRTETPKPCAPELQDGIAKLKAGPEADRQENDLREAEDRSGRRSLPIRSQRQ